MANIITKFDGWNALVSLPPSYTAGTKTYPTIVFFPGAGEIGTDINKLRLNGPNAYVDKGWDGTVTVDSKKIEFIVVSIQPTSEYPRPADIKKKLDVLFSTYRVNKDFVFATGLSRGSWISNSYVTYLPTLTDFSYQKTFKAVVSAMGQRSDDNFGVGEKWPNGFKSYAKNGGKELNVEQIYDLRGGDQVVKAMNTQVPGSATYITINKDGGGHTGWRYVYGDKNIEPDKFSIEGKSQNMYEWLGRIAISTATDVPTPQPEIPKDKVIKISGTVPNIAAYEDKILNVVGPLILNSPSVLPAVPKEGVTINFFNSSGSQIIYPDSTKSNLKKAWTSITYIDGKWEVYGKLS